MNNRDLELLSTYLDGQLSQNESARLETRVKADPELESTLAELRAARNLLRKLPQRKAPRNFTLTRKMVGLNPPLPRSYSFFRFATAFASLLLALTFAANVISPRLSYVGPINIGWGGGYGGIGGGPAMQSAPEEMAIATEAPAMPAAEAPAMELLPLPTPTMSASEDSARIMPTAEAPMAKSSGAGDSAQPNPLPEEKSALISIGWQITFLVVAVIGAAVMFILRQSAKRRWR